MVVSHHPWKVTTALYVLNRGITFHSTKAVLSHVGVLWTGLQTNGDSDSKGAVVLVSQPCMPIAF